MDSRKTAAIIAICLAICIVVTIHSVIESDGQKEMSNKTNITDEIPFHEFQVANLIVEKWVSSETNLHDNILLSMHVGKPEFWRFEREKNEALWSFHVLSRDGDKLYISYDNNSDSITLELRNDSDEGKKRFFRILLQENDTYIIQAQYGNRYLTSKDRKLEMFTPREDDLMAFSRDSCVRNTSKNCMLWFLKKYFDELDRYQVPIICQIMGINRKWISIPAYNDQPVLLAQTGSLEKWNVTPSSGSWTFSPTLEPSLFVSVTQSLVHLVEGNRSNSLTREFKMKWTRCGKFKLQSMLTSGWLAGGHNSNPSHIVVNEEKYATKWSFPLLAISYQRKNRVSYFPPYPF